VAITGQFTNNITQNKADNHREGNEDDLRHADLPEKDPKRHNLRVLEEDYEYQYYDHKRNDYFRFFREFLEITAFLFLHVQALRYSLCIALSSYCVAALSSSEACSSFDNPLSFAIPFYILHRMNDVWQAHSNRKVLVLVAGETIPPLFLEGFLLYYSLSCHGDKEPCWEQKRYEHCTSLHTARAWIRVFD
jgi:hypothetical protein